MAKKMIALVGEQPIPNLLPILHDEPAQVLLMRTSRTRDSSLRMKKVLHQRVAVEFLDIADAYNISDIYQALRAKLEALGWPGAELVFNVTGGTKPMSIAAYQLAADWQCPVLYLESEQKRTQLRQYDFEAGHAVLKREEIVPTLLKIPDYLHAYLPGFIEKGFSKDRRDKRRLSEGGLFEQAVYQALEPHVDEIVAGVNPAGVEDQIDIDLVVRCGNQVGIFEVKNRATKKGLDQLAMAGGRAYLGIYTARFLVTVRLSNRQLKALAAARNITVIELPNYEQGQPLGEAEAAYLVQKVRQRLGAT